MTKPTFIEFIDEAIGNLDDDKKRALTHFHKEWIRIINDDNIVRLSITNPRPYHSRDFMDFSKETKCK